MQICQWVIVFSNWIILIRSFALTKMVSLIIRVRQIFDAVNDSFLAKEPLLASMKPFTANEDYKQNRENINNCVSAATGYVKFTHCRNTFSPSFLNFFFFLPVPTPFTLLCPLDRLTRAQPHLPRSIATMLTESVPLDFYHGLTIPDLVYSSSWSLFLSETESRSFWHRTWRTLSTAAISLLPGSSASSTCVAKPSTQSGDTPVRSSDLNLSFNCTCLLSHLISSR